MKFEIDIEGGKTSTELSGWLQCLLVTICQERPELDRGRILIRDRQWEWYVKLVVYGKNSLVSAEATDFLVESAADQAIERLCEIVTEQNYMSV